MKSLIKILAAIGAIYAAYAYYSFLSLPGYATLKDYGKLGKSSYREMAKELVRIDALVPPGSGISLITPYDDPDVLFRNLKDFCVREGISADTCKANINEFHRVAEVDIGKENDANEQKVKAEQDEKAKKEKALGY